MRWATVVTVAAGLLIVACNGDTSSAGPENTSSQKLDEAPAPGECLPQVRYDGHVYDAIGYTSKVAMHDGTADLSTCSDVGSDARGSYFSKTGDQADVYTFRDVAPSRAIAIAEEGTYGVYMSEYIPTKKAERILLTKLDGHFKP